MRLFITLNMALALASAVGPAWAAQQHTLDFISIDGGGVIDAAAGRLTMSVSVGQPDAAVLTSDRLELACGFLPAGLKVGACGGRERLRANCGPQPCGHRFKAVLRNGVPGAAVTFQIDGRRDRRRIVSPGGRARAAWCPASDGRHTVTVLECNLEDIARCR